MTTQLAMQRIEKDIAPEYKVDYAVNRDKIERILELKDKKNVLILGHNYMHPLVYQLSGKNERGDSLALSRYAANTDKPVILFDGVRFMAETAKILNPDKKVLIADMNAGCSLADNFTAEDVLRYKEQFPGAPVVTYINSYADVKAESDYCCTSSNGLKVVEHAARVFGSDRVIFIPDSLMGKNLEDELKRIGKGIDLVYPGKYDDKYEKCEVHEMIKPEHIMNIREQFGLEKGNPETAVVVHWECLPETVKESDFAGSTSEMINYVAKHSDVLKRVYFGTECEMTANLAAEYPNIEFVRTCSIFCQHMRKITLDKILNSLENDVYEVNVDPEIAKKARIPIERMLAIK